MYALFEDAGKFLAGRVMTEADTSMQIELDSGKRADAGATTQIRELQFTALDSNGVKTPTGRLVDQYP